MTELRDWTRLPSRWVEAAGLRDFEWQGEGKGSANVAALDAARRDFAPRKPKWRGDLDL